MPYTRQELEEMRPIERKRILKKELGLTANELNSMDATKTIDLILEKLGNTGINAEKSDENKCPVDVESEGQCEGTTQQRRRGRPAKVAKEEGSDVEAATAAAPVVKEDKPNAMEVAIGDMVKKLGKIAQKVDDLGAVLDTISQRLDVIDRELFTTKGALYHLGSWMQEGVVIDPADAPEGLTFEDEKLDERLSKEYDEITKK